jgi:hypothetical protein
MKINFMKALPYKYGWLIPGNFQNIILKNDYINYISETQM